MYSERENKVRLHKKIKEIVTILKLEYTPAEISKNIKDFGVKLSDELSFNRLQWVYPWQEVKIEHWPVRKTGDFSSVKIVYQDLEVLVINKPVNLVVEPGAGHQHDNLLTYLSMGMISELDCKHNHQKTNFHIVHRLDKDTSGVMIIAKTEQSKEYLQNQFRKRSAKKKYLAVVDNHVNKMWTVCHYQTRDKNRPLKQILHWTKEAAENYGHKIKEAKTRIKPILYCPKLNQSLIEVEIYTGRMHQIRVLCESLGFRLTDDSIYNQNQKLDLKTLKLAQVSFRDINSKIVSAEIFKKIQQSIFKHTGFCLLSNYLKLKLITQEVLEVELVNLDQLLNTFKI